MADFSCASIAKNFYASMYKRFRASMDISRGHASIENMRVWELACEYHLKKACEYEMCISCEYVSRSCEFHTRLAPSEFHFLRVWDSSCEF